MVLAANRPVQLVNHLRFRLNFYTLCVAATIFLTTLSNKRHVFLVAAPALAFLCLVVGRGAAHGPSKEREISHGAILVCATIAIIVTIKALLAILVGATGAEDEITTITYLNRWLGDVLWVALLLLMIALFMNTSKRALHSAIWIVLVIHIAAFVAQFAGHYLFGYVLDFSAWMGGDSARTAYFMFFRPTGFFAEPSTFAGAMVVLLACDVFVGRRQSARMTLAVAVVCFVSLSTAGWIFGGGLLLFMVPFAVKSRLARLALGMLIVGGIGLTLASSYGQTQIVKFNNTSYLRTGSVVYTLTERPTWENFVGPATNGPGLGFYARTGPVAAAGADVAAVSDDGTAVYLFILYGAAGVGLFLFFLLYVYRRWPVSFFVLFLLATFTKFTPDTMLFTVFIASVWLELSSAGSLSQYRWRGRCATRNVLWHLPDPIAADTPVDGRL